MTNVPNELRDVWKEIYVLFDTHYKMENTVSAWDGFWEEAKAIMDRHSDLQLLELIVAVSEMISDRMKEKAVS
jgi:hypothetical protein